MILIADSADDFRTVEAAAELARDGFTVSVLSLGTPEGAPIPLAGGGFLKDDAGRIVVPRSGTQELREVARAGGGRFAKLSGDNRDLEFLLASGTYSGPDTEESEHEARHWRDEGPWLVLALLPVAALAFRRGWLLALGLPARRAGRDLRRRRSGRTSGRVRTSRPSPLSPGATPPRRSRRPRMRTGGPPPCTATASTRRPRTPTRARGCGCPLQSRQRARSLRPFPRGSGCLRRGARHRAGPRGCALQPPPGGRVAARESCGRSTGRARRGRRLTLRGRRRLGALPARRSGPARKRPPGRAPGPGSRAHGQQESGDGRRLRIRVARERSRAECRSGRSRRGTGRRFGGSPAGTAPGRGGRCADERGEGGRALEQWLRRIPDDPGGLLRRKFALDYERRGRPDPDSPRTW